MARPMKATSALQGAYTKDAMQERVEVENKLKGKKDDLNAPEFIQLDEIALAKFNKIVKELTDVDIITNVDVDLLAVYSDCWSKYVKATKMLLIQNMVEEQENKLGVVTKIPNPYIKIQQNYATQLTKLASLFGLSPADRSRIAHLQPSDKNEKEDALVTLLKGLKKVNEV